MNVIIEINNASIIVPNIGGYSKVSRNNSSAKPGFFVFHSGKATLLLFETEEEANNKRDYVIQCIRGFWNSNNKWNSNNNSNNKFNSTNKEQGFFNKKKHGR